MGVENVKREYTPGPDQRLLPLVQLPMSRSMRPFLQMGWFRCGCVQLTTSVLERSQRDHETSFVEHGQNKMLLFAPPNILVSFRRLGFGMRLLVRVLSMVTGEGILMVLGMQLRS